MTSPSDETAAPAVTEPAPARPPRPWRYSLRRGSERATAALTIGRRGALCVGAFAEAPPLLPTGQPVKEISGDTEPAVLLLAAMWLFSHGWTVIEACPPGLKTRGELGADALRLQRACDEGIPREVIPCPLCGREHVDGDNGEEFRTRPHHTHLCQFCNEPFDTGRWSFGVASDPSLSDLERARQREAALWQQLEAASAAVRALEAAPAPAAEGGA